MKGISYFIGFILVVLLSVGTVTIVNYIINPYLKQMRDASDFNRGFQSLGLIKDAIDKVSAEARLSKRRITIEVPKGRIKTDNAKQLVYLSFEPDSTFSIQGYRNGIYIDKSPVYLEFFNQYSDGTVPSDWTCTNCSIEANSLAVAGTAWHNLSQTLSNFYFSAEVETGEVFLIPTDPNNLVLFLPFDEGSGSIAYDYSKYANNGTLLDANTTNADGDTPPSWTDGKFGKALSFDGVDDYVEIPDSQSIKEFSQQTICVWVKHLETSSTYNQKIIQKYNWDYWVDIVDDILSYKIKDPDGNVYGSQTDWSSYRDGNWHFICGVYDGQYTYLYVDGILKDSDNVGTFTIRQTTGNLGIGFNINYNSQFWNGTIDEVRIYNRALSEAEIKAEYEAGLKKITSKNTYKISTQMSPYLVFSSPNSTGYLLNVRIKRSVGNELRATLPLYKVELLQNISVSKTTNLVIKNEGVNLLTRRVKIGITTE